MKKMKETAPRGVSCVRNVGASDPKSGPRQAATLAPDFRCVEAGLSRGTLTICPARRRIEESRRERVGLWRSWERASMAWKRSSVRSRSGPPNSPSIRLKCVQSRERPASERGCFRGRKSFSRRSSVRLQSFRELIPQPPVSKFSRVSEHSAAGGAVSWFSIAQYKACNGRLDCP